MKKSPTKGFDFKKAQIAEVNDLITEQSKFNQVIVVTEPLLL